VPRLALPPAAISWISGLLMLAAVVGFALIFASGMSAVWGTLPGSMPPNYSDGFVYVATALAALFGGFFAVALGVKEPSSTSPAPLGVREPSTNPAPLGLTEAATSPAPAKRVGLGRRAIHLELLAFPGQFTTPGRVALGVRFDKFIAIAYAGVYVLAGIAAVVTWITHGTETSSLVKNLAVTFLGLAIPQVSAAARG
jgi:hypothetical protein